MYPHLAEGVRDADAAALDHLDGEVDVQPEVELDEHLARPLVGQQAIIIPHLDNKFENGRIENVLYTTYCQYGK